MADITTPLITVYVANYNYERYVRQAIESVLNQTFTDFEMIIIDDGSTDGSREIISEYEGHPQVRIVFQKNKGLNRTNNVAVSLARGRYIMRLDADDYLDTHALLVMVGRMEAEPELGLVFPDYYYVDDDGRVLGQERRLDFREGVSLMDQPAHGACTLIRTRVLKGLGGYCEAFSCQDCYDLWLKIIRKHQVANINLPLFYYRRHGANLTTKTRRIIETRAMIKSAFVESNGVEELKVLGVLPIRGRSVDPGCVALEPLGGKALLDWTLDAALASRHVDRVMVTTPDENVLNHVKARYGDRVLLLMRPMELAREFKDINETIQLVLEQDVGFDPEAVFLLSEASPFRSKLYIDKAVNTLRIFPVDTVIGVAAENITAYRHDGHGLKLVGNDLDEENGMRFEDQYIYRQVYGTQLSSVKHFRQTGSCRGGRVGHIAFDPYDATMVTNKIQLGIANYLLETHPELFHSRVQAPEAAAMGAASINSSQPKGEHHADSQFS
jgi:CMP-N-acetylneuraminic acid synthetase